MSSEKSLNFVIPIALLVFFGVIYAMSLRADNGFVSFILIGIALVTIVYWTGVIKKMVTKFWKLKNPKIIYGGSVNSKNIDELKKISSINGFLIGGASQNAKNFIDIIKKTIN